MKILRFLRMPPAVLLIALILAFVSSQSVPFLARWIQGYQVTLTGTFYDTEYGYDYQSHWTRAGVTESGFSSKLGGPVDSWRLFIGGEELPLAIYETGATMGPLSPEVFCLELGEGDERIKYVQTDDDNDGAVDCTQVDLVVRDKQDTFWSYMDYDRDGWFDARFLFEGEQYIETYLCVEYRWLKGRVDEEHGEYEVETAPGRYVKAVFRGHRWHVLE